MSRVSNLRFEAAMCQGHSFHLSTFILASALSPNFAMHRPVFLFPSRQRSISYSAQSIPLIQSSDMGNGAEPNGVGVLTLQRALDVARNSEGTLDPAIAAYLERELANTWARILHQPDTYLMTKDELSLFNYYRARFERNPRDSAIARAAIDRFWRHYHAANGY